MRAPLKPSRIDGRLRFELLPLAKRIRSRRLNIRSARLWGWLAGGGAVAVLVGWFAGFPGPIINITFAVFALFTSIRVARLWNRNPINYEEAGTFVEARHPDLQSALRTALEQTPTTDGRYDFLQKRVLARALDHSRLHDWKKLSPGNVTWPKIAHAVTLFSVIVVIAFASIVPPSAPRLVRRQLFQGELAVTPGNAEIQRGSTVVISARFGQEIPLSAGLSWTDPNGNRLITPMSRSLSDPVFAATLPSVNTDLEYEVVFDGASSESYRLTVFDLPTLLQANAQLDYPEYTGLQDRRIEDTRRVSAVEGTALRYEFLVNKPVGRAFLRSADGTEIDLETANPERTVLAFDLTVEEDRRFSLHLVDDSSRVDPYPSDIRIQSLPNHRPNLKMVFPRGDQRLSVIEEIQLQAEATDDFGLVDFGLAFSVRAEDPEFLSLKQADQKDVQRTVVEHLLTLESYSLEPENLVTWFSWAKDYAPDGSIRQTSSDLYFGEVRSFDEIFREQSGGGQQQSSGQQGPQAELLELQRQISISIWKLLKESRTGLQFLESTQVLLDSQEHARSTLAQHRTEIQEADVLQLADDAISFMEKSKTALSDTVEANSLEPLGEAWTASQRAYQALLRMRPPEYDVAQSRGGSGGSNRNQQQLNELQFNSEENRYETESQAQSLTSPEEREKLALLARLKDLARRQQDMNDRLQELQTALTAAKNEEERKEVERELKRLEEEQRKMIADLDEARERMDRQPPGSQSQETREQIEQSREEMRRSTEALEQGSVSQALASGTRAQEDLQQASEDLRKESSSRFAEQLRDIRREARQISEQQKESERAVNELDAESARSLDDSSRRMELASGMDKQREQLNELLDAIRQVTEDSEVAEPGLHRQLYDLLRDQEHGGAQDILETGSRLLRRGFVDQTRNLQPGLTQQLQELREGVERAANSVLGDETSAMRFAQNELDDLSRTLENERGAPGEGGEENPGQDGQQTQNQSGQQDERGPENEQGEQPGQQNGDTGSPQLAQGGQPGGQQPGQTSSGNRDANSRTQRRGGTLADLTQALESLSDETEAKAELPLTGEGFVEWADRLRTVESLLDSPEARERLGSARAQAEELRREYRRNGESPEWEKVEAGVVTPLNAVRNWLREEIARREDPATLQPLDRDPVPERFAEAVQKYYESLGE